MHAPDGRRRTLGFEFLKPARSGRDVLVVEGLSLQAGDKQLLDGASIAIERGEHVALVGPNGSGKTTLLETLLGRREPKAGKIRLGHGVEAAYFSQHEAELDERGSVLDAAMSGTGLKRPEAQKLLGRFLFSGWDEHEKPVVALSGGERRRLALAIVVASGANFLVLDEPTNHLDLESRESLEAALEAFPGTVLLVSHDRALLDAVADRLLAVEDRTIASYPGGWADYVRAQEADEIAAAPPPKPKPKVEKPKRPAKPTRSPIELVEARWRAPRSESRSSSGSWPTTGATPRSSQRIATRARTSRRCSAAGKRCSKRADRRLRDRVEHEDHLVRARRGKRSQLVRERVRRQRRRLRLSTALAGAALELHEQADAPRAPRRGRVPRARTPRRCARSAAGAPRRGCRTRRTTCSTSRRAAGSPRAAAAPCRRPSAAARRAGGGSSTASSSSLNAPWKVTRSPASSRCTTSNASSKREVRRSNGMPNARNSASFQPAPSATRSLPPLTSSTAAAVRARMPGGRNAVHATSGPSSTRSVTPASAASVVQQSHGPRSPRPSPR